MSGNRTIINSAVFAYSNKPKGFFANGELKFTSGANTGVSRTVLVHGDGFAIVRVAFPTDIQDGDAFNVWAGCDKTGLTCATRFVQGASNPELIIDGGFDDGSKWTSVGGWSISGSKATHNDSLSNYSLIPVPQITTVKANTLYDISFTWQDLTGTGWAIDVFYISIGGVTFYVNKNDEGSFNININTKTTAGLLIFPCVATQDDLYSTYFNFSIDTLSVKLGGESPGNYANFFGFEYVPKPEIML